MTWTRLSDTFTDNVEFLAMSRSARLLHIEALVYCNRHERDGLLPASSIPRLTDAGDWTTLVAELAEHGFWTLAADGCWQLDWSDQDTAEEVRARKAYRAETQKRYRIRKEKHARGDHSDCSPRYCNRASVTGNADGHESAHETPSRPAPARPSGRAGSRDDALTRSAGAPRLAVVQDEAWPLEASGGHVFRPAREGDDRCAFPIFGGTKGVYCGQGVAGRHHHHEPGEVASYEDGDVCSNCFLPLDHPVHLDVPHPRLSVPEWAKEPWITHGMHANGHPFMPGGDDGRCGWDDSTGYCGGEVDDPAHGHQWAYDWGDSQQPSALDGEPGVPACSVCRLSRTNPVHPTADRLRGGTEPVSA